MRIGFARCLAMTAVLVALASASASAVEVQDH